MAVDSPVGGRIGRGLVIALALAMALTAGLSLAPPAKAVFQGAAVVLTPGLYTGTNVYVPSETMTVTAYATPGDVLNFQFWDAVATVPTSSINNQTVGTNGQKVVSFPIPATWPDGTNYQVRVTDTTSGQVRVRGFAIESYRFLIWTSRSGYLPGDSVTVSWSATLIKDGSPAPAGNGSIQAYLAAGGNLLPAPGYYAFNASQGSFSFGLATTVATYQGATVFAWFNSTDGTRQYNDAVDFTIGNLRMSVSTDQGTYQPGGIVTVSMTSRVQLNAGGPSGADPTEPGVTVNVTVTDLATGNNVARYASPALTTDAHGAATYVFQLATSPTTGQYQVNAQGTSHSVITVTQSTTFNVASVTSISVVLTLDRAQYLSGDTIQATAAAVPSGTYVYSWTVRDTATATILALSSGSSATYAYPIPSTFKGTLQVSVYANDGQGHTSPAAAQNVQVDYAYLSLSLDKAEYNAGDTITASFSLVHNAAVFTSPTYFYKVTDASGLTVASGNLTATSFTYTTPKPSSTRYTFTVTASQSGRAVSGSLTSYLAGGYLISVTLDKSSYMPGDTMQISYAITARGRSTLPQQFRIVVSLYGGGSSSAITTSPTGTIPLLIPQGTSNGDLLLYVADATTGAFVYETVHIGSVNPLLTPVGGVPMIDWLVILLIVILILAVVLLWRRTGMGPGPKAPAAGKPATPPPPPSGGSPPQASGPMSVTCGHCGKPIEITTSRRPIEVMCPACGETQVVQ